MDSLERTNADLQASIADLQESDTKLAENIDETQGQLDALSSSVEEDILNLNSTLGLQDSQINILEIQNFEQSEAIMGINNEIYCVKTRLSVIESQNQDSFPFLASGPSSAISDHSSQMTNEIWIFENLFKLPASCQEVRDNPIYNEKNGLWFIQPTLDYEPFYVNCSFPTDVSLPAETILQPKMSGFGFTSLPNSSSGCHEPGCYQGKLYAVTFQITNHTPM